MPISYLLKGLNKEIVDMIKGGISVIIKTHVHVVELNVYFRRKLRVITKEYVSSSPTGRRSDSTPDTSVRFLY